VLFVPEVKFNANLSFEKSFQERNFSLDRFSTTSKQNQTASYFHKMPSEPLKFRNVGQQLSLSAIKYADRESIVSCHENSRLTFAESLEKVKVNST
jgi:hypothetical protein